MKNLISKSLVVAALMSPAITLFAASAHFGPGIDAYINTLSVSDTVQTDYSERKSNPLYDSNGKEVVNPLYNPAKNLQTRKRVEVLKSNKNTEADNQRKGWDGTVKGGSIQEESMNGSNNPAGSEQQKANINTSRSNIKSGLQSPTDSQHHRGIDKKDIKRGMTNETGTMQPIRNDSTSQNADRGLPVNRLKTKHDTAKNSVGNIR